MANHLGAKARSFICGDLEYVNGVVIDRKLKEGPRFRHQAYGSSMVALL
jgi:hypothetical protein